MNGRHATSFLFENNNFFFPWEFLWENNSKSRINFYIFFFFWRKWQWQFFDQGCVLWVEQLNLLRFHCWRSGPSSHISNPSWELSDWLPIRANFDSYCFTANLTLPQPSSLHLWGYDQHLAPFNGGPLDWSLCINIQYIHNKCLYVHLWLNPLCFHNWRTALLDLMQTRSHHIVFGAFHINTICAFHFSRLLFHPPPCTLHQPPHRPAAHLLLCPRKPLFLLLLSALSFLATINRDCSATQAGIPEVTDTHTRSGCKQPWLWQTRL